MEIIVGIYVIGWILFTLVCCVEEKSWGARAMFAAAALFWPFMVLKEIKDFFNKASSDKK